MVINFVKLANRWYAQLPNYPGKVEDLEMVLGADVLLDIIDSEETGIVSLEVYNSEEEFVKKYDIFLFPDYTIDFVEATGDDGANYRLREYKHDLWLCNVTKYVFGEFPLTIYIIKNESNKS